MHCSGCGLIIGKDHPLDLCRCPRCGRVLYVAAYAERDGLDGARWVWAEGPPDRRVALYVSEAKLRFLLAGRTRRPREWEPLVLDLEEERLRRFALDRGWAVGGVHRDPGPHLPDGRRPLARLQHQLGEGAINAVLVSDFAHLPRRDLKALFDLALAAGGELLAIAPHPVDPNLALDEIDYESVPEADGAAAAFDRLWTRAAREALDKLQAATGWHFVHYLPQVMAHAAGAEALKGFREEDPRCRTVPWREVLTRAAIARWRREGGLSSLAPPRLLACVLCRRRHLESALPRRLMELTLGHASYCRTCLERAFSVRPGEEALAPGPAEIDAAADAEAAIERFRELPGERLHAFLVQVLADLDAAEASGSRVAPSNLWLDALRGQGLLAHCGAAAAAESLYRARDGHLSATLGVALVDNWLAERGLPHRLDVRYPYEEELNPRSALRADLGIEGGLVEFLGLRGRDELGKDVATRLEICRRAGLELKAVYAEDLLVEAVLERKLGRRAGEGGRG